LRAQWGCEIEIPAAYKTVKKRMVKNPASVRKITIPAEYSTVRVTEVAATAETVAAGCGKLADRLPFLL